MQTMTNTIASRTPNTVLKSYKGRSLQVGDLVKVYRNLHNGLFSLVPLFGEHKDRVVAHGNDIRLVNVQFKVYETGRQKVIREQKKNVHAYAVGVFDGFGQGTFNWVYDEVTYNPYKQGSFYYKNVNKTVQQVNVTICKDGKMFELK